MKHCTKCGKQLDDDDIFCEKCGFKCETELNDEIIENKSLVESEIPKNADEILFCEKCGKQVCKNDKFCHACGTLVKQIPLQPDEYDKLHTTTTNINSNNKNSNSKILISVICLAIVVLIAMVGIIFVPMLFGKTEISDNSATVQSTTSQSTTAEPTTEPQTTTQDDFADEKRVSFGNYSLVLPDDWTYVDDGYGNIKFYEIYNFSNDTDVVGFLISIEKWKTPVGDDYHFQYERLGEKNGYFYYAFWPSGIGISYDQTANEKYESARAEIDSVLESFEFN